MSYNILQSLASSKTIDILYTDSVYKNPHKVQPQIPINWGLYSTKISK